MTVFIHGDFDAHFDTPEEATIFTLLCSFTMERVNFRYTIFPVREHDTLGDFLNGAADFLVARREKK